MKKLVFMQKMISVLVLACMFALITCSFVGCNFVIEHPFEDHSYVAVITEPTCTEQGYTTYTCKCGDSYISDYVPMLVPSEGLICTLNLDYASYSVSGIGTCSDRKLVIPNSYNGLPVTNISAGAFAECTSFTSVVIPDSVTSIGMLAFVKCITLMSITIPDSVTNIGDHAFYGCITLVNVTIPESVTRIGDAAFAYCSSLTSIEIPDSVTSMGGGVFRDSTSLARITIGNSVTSIDNYAFYNCTSLTSITIPDSVTSIGLNAFTHCTSLTSITFEGTVEQWNAISFGDYWNTNVPAIEVICSDGTVSMK